MIAGSYVPKTTAQVESLIQGRGDKLETVVLEVEDLLRDPKSTDETILQAAGKADQFIVAGRDVLVMTSRKLISGSDERTSLDIGTVVANALVLFLRTLDPRPRYVIAKVFVLPSSERKLF